MIKLFGKTICWGREKKPLVKYAAISKLSQVQKLLAQIYQESNNIEKAILAATDLANFIPYKFTYKELLLDLHLSNNDMKSAKEVAALIKLVPVKKGGQRVTAIKNKAAQLLYP